jgi:hypothetical protein
MTKIYTVDALSGSGKTYAAIRYAVERARIYEKFVIVQPSKDLIQQSYKDCLSVKDEQKANISVNWIDSDARRKTSVQGEIINHLKADNTRGEILFITHAAFLAMPNWRYAHNWNVLFDELPVVDKEFTRNVPTSHPIVTDHISADSDGSDYYQLMAKDPKGLKALRGIAENPKKDEVLEVFRDMANVVISPHWEVFAKKENWDRVMNGDSEDGKNQLLCFGLRKPTIFQRFKSATVMGAMLTESVMYKLWPDRNVTFEPHPVIEQKARDRMPAHENGKHLTIRYFFEQRWSKNFRDTSVNENGNAIGQMEYIRRKMSEMLTSEPFLWVANKDVPDAYMKEFTESIRLSNSPHGLNQYQDIHNVVFLSALNPRTPHFKFMKYCGINGDDLRDALVHQSTYQAVMRSSLRNPDSTEPKTVYVSDKQTAEWLAISFPGCAIGQIANPAETPKKRNGRPPEGDKAMTPAEKQKRYREKLKDLKRYESTLYNSGFVTSPQVMLLPM